MKLSCVSFIILVTSMTLMTMCIDMSITLFWLCMFTSSAVPSSKTIFLKYNLHMVEEMCARVLDSVHDKEDAWVACASCRGSHVLFGIWCGI